MVEQNCQWDFLERPFKRWHELCTTREGDMCKRKSFCCIALQEQNQFGNLLWKEEHMWEKKNTAQEKYIGESYKHNWLEVYIRAFK